MHIGTYINLITTHLFVILTTIYLNDRQRPVYEHMFMLEQGIAYYVEATDKSAQCDK
jgi:hypothetical protein